jgi:Zn-dependent membrane protease YugP
LVLMIPPLLFALWASWRTRSSFKKYSRVRTMSGLTGAQAAQRLLATAGIRDVDIVPHHGMLSDHYNPVTKKLALSEAVYGSPSVAAVGVACHEAGHAIQHAQGYKPLAIRSALVPTANVGSRIGYFVMFGGLLLMMLSGNVAFGQQIVLFGAILFSAVLLFQLVTLPVEFDASNRAKAVLASTGIVSTQEEAQGVSKVLGAAAMTYVAGALTSIATLAYLLMSRRD